MTNPVERLRNAGVEISVLGSEESYNLIWADTSCTVRRNDNLWVFEKWERNPGPDVSDFSVAFSTSNEAFGAAFDFYFGVATIVDSWNVPLHQHPELSYEGVQRAISEAVNISPEAFDSIEERRRLRIDGSQVFGKTRWEQALQYQFLKILHTTDPHLLLQLRRDMQEAYIVHV